MTKEYAALLAQVIPVIALAAAIELRALVKRYEELRAPRSGPEVEEDASELGDPLVGQIFLGVSAWALCAVIPVLASGELKALSVVAGHDVGSSFGPLLDQGLTNAIGAVFVIPAIEAGIRLWLATTKKEKTRKLKVSVSLTVVGLFIGIPTLLGWIF